MLDLSCSIGADLKTSVGFEAFFEVANILELKPVNLTLAVCFACMLSSHNTTKMHVIVSLLMEHLTLVSALKAASMRCSVV